MQQDARIARITLPTASFSLTKQQIAWIALEAKRRKVKKSVFVRSILDRAMNEPQPLTVDLVVESEAA